jgi:lipopolysaccharide biosynthesis glycosyltransferase
MDIVACTDKRFVMPTGVMMYSVCCNNEDADIVFHLVCSNNVSDKDKADLCGEISKFSGKKIVFYDIDTNFVEKIPAITNRTDITITAYFRLFLTEILPDTIDKVLYLDGDVIVRNAILPLWNLDISNYPIAAATDCMVAVEPEEFERLGYPMSYGYFNSGVCILNLDYWRKNNCIKDFIGLLVDGDKLRYYDQDVLNMLFHTSKLDLPIKYNLMCDYVYKNPKWSNTKFEKEISEALQDPVIIHYAGSGDKPWYKYIRNKSPLSALFYKYQNYTMWKGIKYDLRSPKLKIINFIADLMRVIGLKPKMSSYELKDVSKIV